MKIYADKNGAPITVASGDGMKVPPANAVITLAFDEETNQGLARILGEQTEWPNIVVTDRAIAWHGAWIPIQPDGEQRNEQKEVQALVARLYDDDARLGEDDVRSLLRILIRRPASQDAAAPDVGATSRIVG